MHKVVILDRKRGDKMTKEIRNILAARINTVAAMLADDANRLAFSGERYYKQNLMVLQKDFDTLRLLSEITFEVNNVLTSETE